MRRRRGPATIRSLVIELVLVALVVAGFYVFLEIDGADAVGRFTADRWQP